MKFSLHLKQNILTFVIFNILSFGVYLGAFFMMKSAQEHTSLLLNQLETDIKTNDTLQSIETVLTDAKGDIEKLESYFVGQDGIVDFIETVESYGRTSGVKMSIDFVGVEGGIQANNKGDVKETLRIKLSTEGSWTATVHFLSLIEHIPFRINMDRVRFLYSSTSASSLSFTPPKGVTLPKNRVWKSGIELTVLKLR